MGLNDCYSIVIIDDESGETITLCMHQSARILTVRIDQAQVLPHSNSLFDFVLEKGPRRDGFVKGDHSDRNRSPL